MSTIGNISERTSSPRSIVSLPSTSSFTELVLHKLSSIGPLAAIEPTHIHNEEELKTFSLLENLHQNVEAPSTHLFAFIHAESLLMKTRWMGGCASSNLTYLRTYLQSWGQFKEPSILNRLLALIDQVLKGPEDGAGIMRQVANLKPHEGYLMHGGWSGRPGHTMLYKFTRRSNGNYDILIFNTGVLQFHACQEKRHKMLCAPVEIIEDVIPEALCLSADPTKCTSEIFDRLVEYNNWTKASSVEDADIFIGVFGHLAAKRRPLIRTDGDFITNQRSGSCSWKPICAWLRYEIGDVEGYKQFIRELKFQTTLSFYYWKQTCLNEDSEEADEQRILLRQAATSQLRRLAKFHGTQPDHPTQFWTLKDLVQRLDRAEQSLRAERLKKTVSANWRPGLIHIDYKWDILYQAYRKVIGFQQERVAIDSFFTLFSLNPTENFLRYLEAFKSGLEQIKKAPRNDSLAIKVLIEKCAEALPPMSAEFWETIPPSDLTKAAALLFEFLESYANEVIHPASLHAQEQNCALGLFAALHRLCLSLDSKFELSHYGIYIEPFLEGMKERLFLFFEPKVFEKRLELLHYFETLNPNKKLLFNFNQYTRLDEDSVSRLPDYEFLKKAMDHVPKLSQTFSYLIDDRSKKYPKCSLEVVTAGVLLSSPDQFERAPETFHLSLLMKAAVYVQMFAGYLGCNEDPIRHLEFKLDKKSREERALEIRHYYKAFASLSYGAPMSRSVRAHRKDLLDRAVSTLMFSRERNMLDTEAGVLTSFNWKESEVKWDDLLACTNCAPILEPAKVLHYFREHLTELALADSQTLFELIFFKPVIDKTRGWWVPLFEELKDPSTALFNQIDDLIKQGLNTFYEKQPGQRPILYACLFFLRLASQIRRVAPSAPVFDSLPLLNLWLKEGNFNPEELGSLHLHRIAAYASLSTALSDDEQLEVLTSWIYFKQQPLHPHWQEPHLEESAARFVYDQLPEFQRILANPEKRISFFNSLLVLCNLENLSQANAKWVSKGMFYEVQLPQSRFWQVNILTGTIACESGIAKLGSTQDVMNRRDYIRLFGSQRFFLRQSGNLLHFIHPRYGSIRINPNPSNNILIYRSLEEGRWVQYIPPDSDCLSQLPLPLLADHSHWIEMRYENASTLYIEPLKAGSHTSYRVKESGITEQKGEEKHPLRPVYLPALERFEKQEAFYLIEKEGKSTLELPRYRALNGKALQFIYSGLNDEPLWSDNPHFALAAQQRKGLLGPELPNYLYLKEVKGPREKLLVPLQPLFAAKKSLTHWQTLDVQDVHRTIEYQSAGKPAWCPQKGVYTYLEFDLVQNGARDVVTPLSIEGTLFLGLLCLIQRDYLGALKQLRELSPADTLSSCALKILNLILSASDQIPDLSGCNAAVRLHAFLLLNHMMQRPDVMEKLSQEEWKNAENQSKKDYQLYLENLTTVPSSLQLSKKEELILCDQPSRRSYLQEGNYLASHPRLGKTVSYALPFSPYVAIKGTEYVLFYDLETEKPNPSSKDYQSQKSTYDYKLRRIREVSFKKEFDDAADRLSENFGYFYRQAKQVRTFAQAISLSLRLDFIQKKQVKEPVEKYSTDYELRRLIHLALLYPESAPDLIETEDAERKATWFLQAVIAYQVKRQEPASTRTRFEKEQDPLQAARVHTLSMPPANRLMQNPLEELVKRFQIKAHHSSILSLTSLEGPLVQEADFRPLAHQFFEATSPHDATLHLSLRCSADQLSEHERVYLRAIEEELKGFEEELKLGEAQNLQRKEYRLKNREELPTLKSQLEGQLEQSKEKIQFLRERILILSGKRSNEQTESFLQGVLEGGEVLALSDLESIINCWLVQEPSAYRTCNPFLSSQEIIQLDQLITLYLQEATCMQQVKRALSRIEKIEAGGNGEVINELAHILEEGNAFDPQQLRALRVLEYRANIRVRKQQAELIWQLIQTDPLSQRYRHAIAQMIMGGGKTSVLASILLFLAAQRGNQAIFVGPTAQFETLKRNLSLTQRKYFGQEVLAIAMNRAEMTLENLKWALQQLEEAKRLKGVILFRPDTIPALQLEALSMLRYASKAENHTDEQVERIQTILEILHILRTKSATILDEVDVLLDPKLEVNFPFDESLPLDSNLIDWMRALFELMIDETIVAPNGKKIAELLDLCSEERHFDESALEPIILPTLGSAIFQKRKEDLCLLTEHEKAFTRYVCGQMDPHRLQADDQKFLSHLKALSKSKEENERLAADLIATTKYIFLKILPCVLICHVGKDFGRDGIKVVPFEGIDSPTRNQFGNPLEAAAYHFLTALATGVKLDRGIHIDQVRHFAMQLQESAEHYVEKRDELFDQTPEAEECLHVTGFPLSQVLKNENLAKAKDAIHQDVKKILLVEAETIAKEVRYFPDYYSSNSQSLIEMLSTEKENQSSSVRSMSGTPWDLPAYSHKLSENLQLDKGVEGQIAHVMIRRWQNNPHWLHVITKTTVQCILDQALKNNPRAEKIRGIIDAAGLFKKSDGLTVASEIQDYFKDRPDIETVLFFGRRHAKERPDCLMALRKGSKKPIIIGSTSADVLERFAISPETSFIFFDDRHCEATDLRQKSDAVNLLTFDEKIIRRTLFQAMLRLRGYFKGQDIELVIHQDSKKLLLNGGNAPVDFLCTAVKNQALRMGKDAYRALRHAIAEVPRSGFVIQKIFDERKNFQNLKAYFKAFEELVRSNMQLQPYEQFGALDEMTNATLAIDQFVSLQQERFNKISHDTSAQKALEASMKKISERGKKSPYFPTAVQTALPETEQQVEIHREVRQEVRREVEVQLEQELKQELQRYLTIGHFGPRAEQLWNDAHVQSREFPYIKEMNVDSLGNHMASCPYYAQPYYKIFDPVLIASRNWICTTSERLPVFHPHQKPAHQLLVIKQKEHLKLMLLSIEEAAFFKEYLKRARNPDLWLILSNGIEISSHPHAQLDGDELQLFNRAMIQVHFLNGNAHALDKEEESALQFISDKESDLKIRFLKLRVEKDVVQRRIFYRSALVAGSEHESLQIVQHAFRREFEIEMKKRSKLLKPEEIAVINPRLVNYLNNNQVKYLTTREQLQKLTIKQVEHVTSEQVPLLPPTKLSGLIRVDQINAVNSEHYTLLTLAQIRLLNQENVPLVPDVRTADLSYDQVPHVPPRKIHFLTDPQIQAVSPEQVPYLERERLKLLVNEQQVAVVKDLTALIDTQIPLVSAAQVAHLAKEKYRFLTKETQIQAVAPQDLNHLQDHQLKMLSKEQIPHLRPEKVPHLEDRQLQYLITVQQVETVEPSRVSYLADAVLPYLLDTQVPGASESQVPLLKDAHVALLTDTQVGYVSAAQVPLVEDLRLKHLKSALQVAAVSNDRVQYLSDAAIPHLIDAQVPYATDNQVHLLVGQQLTQIKEEQLPFVISSQVPDVIDAFIPKLHHAQIPGASAQQVPLFIHSQLEFLQDSQIPHVCPDQVPHLKDEQFKHLNQAEQIQAVPTDKLHLIDGSMVKHLNEGQVPFVKDARIPQLKTHQIKWITSAQLPHLKGDQVQYITDTLLAHLSGSQVPYVPSDKLALLKVDLLPFLTDRQISEIDPSRVNDLPLNKLYALSSKGQIAKLSADRVHLLTRHQLKTLYPSLLVRIALVITGIFYRIIQLIAFMMGLYIAGLCCKCVRPVLEHINRGSGRLWMGVRALSPC